MQKVKFSASKSLPLFGGTGMGLSLSYRLFCTFSFLLFFLADPSCQNNTSKDTGQQYQLRQFLPLQAKSFTTDKLQNIYYISAGNDVVKLNPGGAEQFRYINKTLGESTYIDATNPFNLLLFFPDYQNVIILDRTMNVAGQLNLFQLGLFQVHAIGAAGDGNLWVFDEVNFRLKKIGKDGAVILQSADLSLEIQKTIRPVFLLERGQFVYLNDPHIGILVFDVFGRYTKTIPLQGLDEFQVIGDLLYFCKEGKLLSFHLKALVEKPVLLPKEIAAESDIRIEKDRLYVWNEEGLRIYDF